MKKGEVLRKCITLFSFINGMLLTTASGEKDFINVLIVRTAKPIIDSSMGGSGMLYRSF